MVIHRGLLRWTRCTFSSFRGTQNPLYCILTKSWGIWLYSLPCFYPLSLRIIMNILRSFAIQDTRDSVWTSGFKNNFSCRNYFTFGTVFSKERKIVTESNDAYRPYYVYSVQYGNKGLNQLQCSGWPVFPTGHTKWRQTLPNVGHEWTWHDRFHALAVSYNFMFHAIADRGYTYHFWYWF